MSFARISSSTVWQTAIEVRYFRAETHFRKQKKKEFIQYLLYKLFFYFCMINIFKIYIAYFYSNYKDLKHSIYFYKCRYIFINYYLLS